MASHLNTTKSNKKIPLTSRVKHFFLGIMYLDKNPAFDSEAAAWIDENNLIHVYAYIHINEETWQHQFYNLINNKEYAPYISTIEIKGTDQGTKGTRLFDLSELLKDNNTQFMNLTSFEVEQTSTRHKNISMITCNDFYDENGAGGKILDKMPNLTTLTLPSAPTPSFFERKSHPLQFLNLQAGYDHQGFINRLAHSTTFPLLRELEWTDGPGLPLLTSCVPAEHFELLRSKKRIKVELNGYNAPYDSSLVK